MGKSLFGFQLADAPRGKSIGYLKNESEAQNVLYLDLENGEKVFERRYSEVDKIDGKETYSPYDWSDNLKVVDLADPINIKYRKRMSLIGGLSILSILLKRTARLSL